MELVISFLAGGCVVGIIQEYRIINARWLANLYKDTLDRQDKQKEILAAQQARRENRAPLIEVINIPEEERSESENKWVKDYLEGRERWLKGEI